MSEHELETLMARLREELSRMDEDQGEARQRGGVEDHRLRARVRMSALEAPGGAPPARPRDRPAGCC